MIHKEESNQPIELGLEIPQTIKLVYRNIQTGGKRGGSLGAWRMVRQKKVGRDTWNGDLVSQVLREGEGGDTGGRWVIQ